MASLQKICFWLLLIQSNFAFAQVKWQNVDSLFQPLPNNFHVFKSTDSLDGKPFVAYYVSAKLKDKKLNFTTDTTFKRRFTPQQFYQKNNQPVLVVNGTFFSFETNQNLNVVVKNGKIISHNVHIIAGRGKDTLTYRHPFGSAFGIDKKRNADVAWVLTDSSKNKPFALEKAYEIIIKDTIKMPSFKYLKRGLIYPSGSSFTGARYIKGQFKKWKVKTAIGGGPVLLQNGEIKITNNEELKFNGKTGLTDKHPRTAMGYTATGDLIIMVVEGRNPTIADGVALPQLAQLLKHIGCVEALNLDGGGSSCMLINGKETIKPSDKTGQRAVPAVFLIQQKK
jgi:Phosphodiester glycosidase